MARIDTDIGEAARLLRAGALVAIPTETVYGLAANAFDEEAVLKIFEAKQRPAFDPLIVHVHDHAQVRELVSGIPPEAALLMENFWPGPLTLVLPKTLRVPDLVTSGLDTVGVRMPAHSVALELLRQLDFPLAAPSANPFGYVSPTTAQHVADQLGAKVAYILDGGPCAVGVESTIVGWEQGAPMLYRPGGVTVEAIERIIGPLSRPDPARADPKAPGMLASHYAPRKPVIIGDPSTIMKAYMGRRIGVIGFSQRYGATYDEVLSVRGDLHEAARKLFSALRRLDNSDADLIVAEIFPEEGLGRAINDRLGRAGAAR